MKKVVANIWSALKFPVLRFWVFFKFEVLLKSNFSEGKNKSRGYPDFGCQEGCACFADDGNPELCDDEIIDLNHLESFDNISELQEKVEILEKSAGFCFYNSRLEAKYDELANGNDLGLVKKILANFDLFHHAFSWEDSDPKAVFKLQARFFIILGIFNKELLERFGNQKERYCQMARVVDERFADFVEIMASIRFTEPWEAEVMLGEERYEKLNL